MISSSTKSIAIILARLNSSRLPRKQLRLINGKPMIDHIIERLSEVKGIDQLILATGPKEENEDLARQVHSYGIKTFFDDDVNDVTGRIARAGECFKAGFIVTVSGDCPLIDPEFIQRGIALLKDSEADFVYVDHLKYKCLHEGIEFHTKENWETLDELSSTWYHKEHPGSVLKEGNHSFRGAEITPRVEFQRHDFRMSVDTRSDLFFMNQIYQELSSDDKIVDLHDVLNLIDKKPWLKKINDHVHQKEVEEKSKTFLFITQASPEIGMGHLSRCIALATEIQESYGAKTIFYLNSDEIALTILKQQGFIVSLESQLGPKTDILAIVQMNKISRIIVDIKPDILYSRFDFLPRMYSPIVLIDILPEGEFSGIPSVIPAVNLDRQARPKNVY
ncbi:MAG: NTP transferase domain-containing protein, partial [Calditrichaeota bacterium]|nr:NTP transferase domain-containing protein [Calditrichota bacterium]